MATAVASAGMRRGFALRLPERLPDLKGKWLTAYSVVWAVALVIAVVAPVRGALYNYYWLKHVEWRPHGIVAAQTDQAGDDRQRLPRDIDVDPLEIVLARAADGNVGQHPGFVPALF